MSKAENNKYKSLQGIKILDCSGCSHISYIPNIEGITELYCSNTNVINIPNIKGLKLLWCYGCPELIQIPAIEGLTDLWCHDCPELIQIPIITDLIELWCFKCPKITKIPDIKELHILYCVDCINITEITNIKSLDYLDCNGCMWINYKNNNYKNNIKKLIRSQCWFKSYTIGKKLSSMIRSITEIYYNPMYKGGYIAKRDILRSIN